MVERLSLWIEEIVKGLGLDETFEVESNDGEKTNLVKSAAIERYGYKGHLILINSDPDSDDEEYRLIINTKKENFSIIEDYSSKDKRIVLSFSTKNNDDLRIGVEDNVDLGSQFFVMQRLSQWIKRGDIKTESNFFSKKPFGRFSKMVNKIKYLSLDIDDTIFKTSDINEVFCENDLKRMAVYIKKLLKLGIKVFINSGRGVKDVILVIKTLEKMGGVIDYAVCENGSVFLNYAKIRNQIRLSLGEIEDACVWVDGLGENEKKVRDDLVAFLKKEVVSGGLATMEKGKLLGISLNPKKMTVDGFREWLKLFLLENKDKIINGLENEKLLKAIISKINSSTTAVDLNPCRKMNNEYVGINKSDGIDLFCQQIGDIKMENDNKTWQIVGIGDSTGDLPVFNRCKWNVVPLNGFKLTTKETKEEVERKFGFNYKIGFLATYETTMGCNQFLEILMGLLSKG